MNRLLNTTGGRPVKNEDLQLFEQLIDFIETMGDMYGDIIMTGVEISGSAGNYTVSSGYIYYDGKLCSFSGATGVSLPYEMEAVDEEITPRDFFDGVTKNTIRSVTITGQSGGGFSLDSDTQRLSDYMPGKASLTEAIGGSNDEAYMTSSKVLSAIRSGSSFVGSESRKGVYERASIADYTNSVANNVVGAALLGTILDNMRISVENIGTWNMDSTFDVTISITIPVGDIIFAGGIIYNDAEDTGYFINANQTFGADVGMGYADSSGLNVWRQTGGFFDNALFDSTTINRGYVFILYKK